MPSARAGPRVWAYVGFASLAPLACAEPVPPREEVVVKDSNQPPVAYDGVLSARAGAVAQGQLSASDVDGDALTFLVVSTPTQGELTVLDPATGTYTYESPPGVSGSDTFAFRVHDGVDDSNVGSVSVLIVPSEGSGSGTAHSVKGFATYDFVPVLCSAPRCELDYGNTVRRPIRGAVVQVLDLAQQPPAVLQETVTGSDGSYELEALGAAEVRVLVLAETLTPAIRVEDNTRNDALYALQSAVVQMDADRMVDVHAPSGWTGSHYGAPRSAAPFAILDALVQAAEAFSQTDGLTLPPLRANWSEQNRPEPGDPSLGQISTSHWDGTEMYLLGLADVDTDEYDVHVIVHEWAHYFETSSSRTDSLGGVHGFGQPLEPRIAFSEGWANAVGSMVLYPDRRYVDTMGPAQQRGFFVDLEDNDGDVDPGWFSEWSVQSILYDLFDPDEEPNGLDGLALGIEPFVEVMLGAHRHTPALTSIFTFLDGLKRALPWTAEAVDALCAGHGISPVADGFGTGESHDGGASYHLPVYHVLKMKDAPVVVTLRGSSSLWSHLNKLSASRLVRFQGDGQKVRVIAEAEGDVDLYLYRRGELLAVAERPCWSLPCVESVPLTSTTDEYVLVVQSFHEVDEEFACRLSIELQ